MRNTGRIPSRVGTRTAAADSGDLLLVTGLRWDVAAPAEPPARAAAVVLRLHAPDGRLVAVLPQASNVRAETSHNGPGSLSFDYPSDGHGAAQLLAAQAGYLVLVEQGIAWPQYFLLDADGDDRAAAGGRGRTITCQHPGYQAYLEFGLVYPQRHIPGGPVAGLDPRFAFRHGTPGAIAKILIDAAKARGSLPYLEYDFTAGRDSAGRVWPGRQSPVYDAGRRTVGSVITEMAESAWCDVRMTGWRLRLFVPDTACAADRPGVVLRLGREVTSGPRSRTRMAVRSHVLSAGKDGAITEAANPATAARYAERREGYNSAGDITDLGTLAKIGDATLAGLQSAPEVITVEFAPAADPSTPRPGRDFTDGDYVRYDQRRLSPGVLEPLRVRSTATQWLDGDKKVSVELNNSFTELDVLLKRRIDRLANTPLKQAGPVTLPRIGPGDDMPDPADSPLVYNDTLHAPQLWNGSAWVPLGGGFTDTSAESVPGDGRTVLAYNVAGILTYGDMVYSLLSPPRGGAGYYSRAAYPGFPAGLYENPRHQVGNYFYGYAGEMSGTYLPAGAYDTSSNGVYVEPSGIVYPEPSDERRFFLDTSSCTEIFLSGLVRFSPKWGGLWLDNPEYPGWIDPDDLLYAFGGWTFSTPYVSWTGWKLILQYSAADGPSESGWSGEGTFTDSGAFLPLGYDSTPLLEIAPQFHHLFSGSYELDSRFWSMSYRVSGWVPLPAAARGTRLWRLAVTGANPAVDGAAEIYGPQVMAR